MTELFYKTILKNLKEYLIITDENNKIIYSNDNNAIKLLKLCNNDEINFNCKHYRCYTASFSMNDKQFRLYQFNDISNEKELELQAITDYKTSLYNVNGLKQKINNFIENDNPCCIIMIDLDNFKQINDLHSHIAGDYVLKEVSDIFKKNTNPNDLVVRFGGDEFLIVLNKNIDKAFKIAEKIRKSIDRKKFIFNNKTIHVTATIGIKEFNSIDNIEDIINNADILMYNGKNNGKNKTVIN